MFLSIGDGADLWLWAVDRDSGTVRWKKRLGGENVTTRKQNMSSPSPVTDGKRVWVLTGTGVVKAFDFEGKELWTRDLVADHGKFGLNWGYASSPLLYQGRVYSMKNGGIVLSRDAGSGKTMMQARLGAAGGYYASPIAAGGRIYVASDEGTVVVFEAADTLRVLARNALPEPIMATPAIADGALYVRTLNRLYAFGEPAKTSP